MCDKKISEEDKKETILELKKLIKGEKSLNELQYDDDYLDRFLVSCHYDVQKAFERIKTFYELLLECPDWFTKDPPVTKKEIIEKDVRVVLPQTDKDGRVIYVVKMGNMDISSMKLKDIIAVDDIWMESIFLNNPAVKNGICVIVDIANYPWRIMKWLTPYNLRTAVRKLLCYPLGDFRFHIVNDSILVHAGLKIVWPFLPDYIKELVKFHFNDRESLHNYINPDVLPKEYGGTNDDINYSDIYEQLFQQNNQIAESFKMYRTVKLTNKDI